MAKEIKLKPSKREAPKDFEQRIKTCWELYQLCKILHDAPKTLGVKVFPK
jgi:hypothetical protein